VYKLQEIQEKDRLLRPGMTVVDLGAAPGGWTQYAADSWAERARGGQRHPAHGPIPGVTILEGDFREPEVLEKLLAILGEGGADLVMSDMAPNISGVDAVDQPRAMYLAELAADLARTVLKPGGDFLVKLFQGSRIRRLRPDSARDFDKVSIRKPKASRPRSREVYAVARGRKLV
jgi:23S rRNA (uridine2552-2'-O)-methyltransferase